MTDSREVRPRARPPTQRTGTRIVSVDTVLQYTSDIPSAQRRDLPGGGSGSGVSSGVHARPAHQTRTPSGRHPLDPKLSGLGAAHLPARSSKTTEKLVLLPETGEPGGDGDEEEDEEDEDAAPPDDEELRRRREGGRRGGGGGAGGRSTAERLTKTQRIADAQLARVTAYCTAQSYKLRTTAEFVRDQHGAKTKLYDDCLYCVYQLPLMGGNDGYRVRSSPVIKNPGGRSVLDEQIEANERRQYREGWHEESDEYSVRGVESSSSYRNPDDSTQDNEQAIDDGAPTDNVREMAEAWARKRDEGRRASNGSIGLSYPSPSAGISSDAETVAELFIFSYGVAVFWNFTSSQEKDLLADMTFSASTSMGRNAAHAQHLSQKAAALAPPSLLPLMTKPLDEGDFETEDLHFQYDDQIEKARIYNDMITLRTSDHMVKLAMSHAVAQSTKLSFFEERMQRSMSEAQHVPRELALKGKLGLTRQEITSLVGRLFESRVSVNLSSNMLDTPNFFWDSEPNLDPLYQGMREYLEIQPRIKVLNERCQVFLDLAEILSESIAESKMTRITWIIIVLIVISILVTCTEVFLRFAILASGKGKKEAAAMLLCAAMPASNQVPLGISGGF